MFTPNEDLYFDQLKELRSPQYKIGDIVLLAHEGMVYQERVNRAESNVGASEGWSYEIDTRRGFRYVPESEIIGKA